MKIKKRLSPRTANQRVAAMDDSRLYQAPKGLSKRSRYLWGNALDVSSQNQLVRRAVAILQYSEYTPRPASLLWRIGLGSRSSRLLGKKILARAGRRLRMKRRQA